MAFDPRQPVTIHNPYPRSKWPIKYGSAVYFVSGGSVLTGTVRWYHPARKVDAGFLISAGNPFFTLEGGVVVSASRVFPKTKCGMIECWKAIQLDLIRRQNGILRSLGDIEAAIEEVTGTIQKLSRKRRAS